MDRRGFLAGLGTVTVASTAGVGAAHPTPDPGSTVSGVDTPSAAATPSEYAPLGVATVAGAKEAVVDETGSVAYVAATDGFATVDVGDPTEPAVLAERRGLLSNHPDGPMRQVFDAKVDGDHLLVAGPANRTDAVNAVVLFDVSDPADPIRVAVYETDYPIHNCDIQDGVAYLTAHDGDRNPVVAADPVAGEELDRWSVIDADPAWRDVPQILRVVHDVRVEADRAYLACWDAGTYILDTGDPTSLELVTRVRGRTPSALVTPESGTGTEQRELPGNDHYVTATPDGSVVGIGMEAWDQAGTDTTGGPGGIELWTVGQSSDPSRAAAIEPPATPDPSFDGVWTTAHNFEVRGDRLYTAWYRGGVRVYRIADPANPELLRAWRDTDRASFWTAQAAVPGDFFVASSVGSAGALPATADGDGRAATADPPGLYTFPDPPVATTTGSGFDVTLPGFGVLGGLAGLGIGGWLTRRCRRQP